MTRTTLLPQTKDPMWPVNAHSRALSGGTLAPSSGCGAAWQRIGFGNRGSEVRILSSRPLNQLTQLGEADKVIYKN